MPIDPDVADIFREASSKNKRHDGPRTITSDKMSHDKPKKLNWSEERDRALATRPQAIPNVINKLYTMAEEGNMDAIKVTLERDFGKVSTPITIDTEAATNEQLLAADQALEDSEG